jgi:hypothetical protein
MKTLMLSTVTAFFSQRAGLFFVLMGVLFGFLSGAEHHAFAVFFLTGTYGIVYLFAIWLAYTLLCVQFLTGLWKQPEYTFVYHTRLWRLSRRFLRFLLMSLGFLQPILYYGVYLISISIQDDISGRLGLVLPLYLIMIAFIMIAAEWRIRNPRLYVVKNSKFIFHWPFPRPRNWAYWSIEWLFRERGVTLLAGKAGAILVATGTMLYYTTDAYDLRLPAVGLLLAYSLNVGISYELYKWESQVWLWGRTLPVSNLQRFGRVLALHAIIILPETLAVLRNGALTFFEICQLFGLGLSVLTLLHSFFYKKEGLLDDSMQTILFGFVGLTILILYKIPLLLIGGVLLVLTYYMFPRWYKV